MSHAGKFIGQLSDLLVCFFRFSFKLTNGVNVHAVDKCKLRSDLEYITVIIREIWQFFITFQFRLFTVNYTFDKLGYEIKGRC